MRRWKAALYVELAVHLALILKVAHRLDLFTERNASADIAALGWILLASVKTSHHRFASQRHEIIEVNSTCEEFFSQVIRHKLVVFLRSYRHFWRLR